MSLFPEYQDPPEGKNPAKLAANGAKRKVSHNEPRCGTCEHFERHQCGGSVIGFCGLLKAKNTSNGKLRTRAMTGACHAYKKIEAHGA